MTNFEGQQLGNYQLLRLLGEGGFSDVYLGKHVHLGTEMAVKVLRMLPRDTDVQAFRKEAKIVAGLKHPHIINVVDFGIEHDTPYIVMDYAPQGTLRQRHPRMTTLPLSTIVSYVLQIGEALQFAHDNKVVHRDVKPENMLIGSDGNILLSDFGIAVSIQQTHSLLSQDEAGTIPYMAPESFAKKSQPASDQYSLAIVVYEWLCGTTPFNAETAIHTAIQHIQTPPPPLRSKIPTIDPRVEQVVMKAMSKDPIKRYSNINAFVQALANCLNPDEKQKLEDYPLPLPQNRSCTFFPLFHDVIS